MTPAGFSLPVLVLVVSHAPTNACFHQLTEAEMCKDAQLEIEEELRKELESGKDPPSSGSSLESSLDLATIQSKITQYSKEVG